MNGKCECNPAYLQASFAGTEGLPKAVAVTPVTDIACPMGRPAARSHQATASDGHHLMSSNDLMWVYGGQTGDDVIPALKEANIEAGTDRRYSYFGDLWELQMKNRRWIRLDPFGSSATEEMRPPNVSAAVLTPRLLPLQGRFHLYLYGGYDGNTYNGAMWRFDLVVEQWQLVSQEHTATSAAARPLARDLSVYTTVVDPNGAATGGCDSYLYMFGGATLEDQSLTHATHGDLWEFCYRTRAWRNATDGYGTPPQPRAGACSAWEEPQYSGDHGRWWVFGGLEAQAFTSPFARDARGDLWSIDFLGPCEGSQPPPPSPPAKYALVHFAPPGEPTCDYGVSVAEADCVDAVKALVGSAFPAAGSNRAALQRGSSWRCGASSGWGAVPIGCSSQTGGDQAAHFRSPVGPALEPNERGFLRGDRSTDTCLSSSYRLVCTGRAHLAPEGSTLCEEGVPTTEANCLAAVKSLVTFTASSRTARVGPEGSTACESGWGTVPIGCSSQTGGDQAAYFRDSLGGGGELDPRCISKIYQPVCMEGDVSGVKSTWVQDDVTSCGRLIYRGHDDQATCQRLCEENDGCHGFTTYYPSCGGKCYHWDAKCTTTSPRTGCWRSTVSSYAVERTALCDESMTGTHGDGYRGCQSKTTTGVACAKWAGQILKTDGTSCASSGLADLSYDDCWALRWKQPDGWIPDAKGNKLDSRGTCATSRRTGATSRTAARSSSTRPRRNGAASSSTWRTRAARRQQGGRDLADLPQRLVRQVVLAHGLRLGLPARPGKGPRRAQLLPQPDRRPRRHLVLHGRDEHEEGGVRAEPADGIDRRWEGVRARG